MDKAIQELKNLIKVTEDQIAELTVEIERHQDQGVFYSTKLCQRNVLQDGLKVLKKMLPRWEGNT